MPSDKFSKEVRSKIMSAIRSSGTKPELLLCKALWSRGYRYRKNSKAIFGKPDISFGKYKVAIFIDSEFFHGFNWLESREKIFSNREYWLPKIERNMKRDIQVNERLTLLGWKVIRFWSKDVINNLENCVEIIARELPTQNKG